MANSIVSQIDLVGSIVLFLKGQGITHLLEREMNTVIRCATEIVDELSKPGRPVTDGVGLDMWLESDQTGISSIFMAGVLSGSFSRKFGYPHDPSDFGRCLGLLDACPGMRRNIGWMSDYGAEWSALVGAWDELEKMYREEFPSGMAPRTYDRMQGLMKQE